MKGKREETAFLTRLGYRYMRERRDFQYISLATCTGNKPQDMELNFTVRGAPHKHYCHTYWGVNVSFNLVNSRVEALDGSKV